jgi:peptidoglycan/xylan/chitin deacetylase (PgdA/CDA1 family)
MADFTVIGRTMDVSSFRGHNRIMKDLAKTTLLNIYKYSGAMAIQERVSYCAGHSFLPILLFHRVTDDIPPDGLTVTTDWFRGLCELLVKRFHVVSLSEAMDLLETRKQLPRRTVALTFDDCYQNNLFAARLLAEYKLPACFFIPTAFPGTDHVFPWDRGLKQMANLTWKDIEEIADLGHEVGSHTVSHADLAKMSMEEMRRELVDSKQTLEKHLGRPLKWFAYPFGSHVHFPPERLSLVFEAGYRGCFSGYGGFVYPGMRDQIIPRIAVPYFRSLLHLELHLAGCLTWMYALKRRGEEVAYLFT